MSSKKKGGTFFSVMSHQRNSVKANSKKEIDHKVDKEKKNNLGEKRKIYS